MSNEPAVRKGDADGGGGKGGGIRDYLLLLFLFIFAVFAGLSKKEREELIKAAKLGRKLKQGDVAGEEEVLSAFEEILGAAPEPAAEEPASKPLKKAPAQEPKPEPEPASASASAPAPAPPPKLEPETEPEMKPRPGPGPEPGTETGSGEEKPASAPGRNASAAAPALRIPPEAEAKIRTAFLEYQYGRIKKYVEDLGYTYVDKERQGKKLGIVVCKEGKIFVNLAQKKCD